MNIKSKEIDLLTGCVKYFSISSKNLIDMEPKYKLIYAAIKEVIVKMKQKIPKEEISSSIYQLLIDGYQKEWFLLPWQLETSIQYDYKLCDRFIQWMDYEKGDIETSVSFVVPHTYIIKDRNVTTVNAKADVVIFNKNQVSAYIIKRKYKREFSYAARKNENKVLACIELQYLLYALQKNYPEKEIRVSMVRLVGKQDSSRELGSFEAKKGDHVISFTAQEYREKRGSDILKNIESDISLQSERTCDECKYLQLCKYNLVYNERVEDGKEAKETKSPILFSVEQKKVIEDYDGYMRVIAGPGSGKTATLVARIKNMLTQGIAADTILAITFTRKAAKEMAERIKNDGIYIATIHSFSMDMLRYYSEDKNIKILSTVEKITILLEILKNGSLIEDVSYQGLFLKFGLIRTLIDQFEKIETIGEENFLQQYPKKDCKNIIKVKKLYDEILLMKNYYTYDKIIAMLVDLLKENPIIQEHIQKRFSYVLVDEVQDVDDMQAELIQLLTGKNLMICGDADQNIYGFRGGSNAFLLEFQERYPDTRLVYLEDNFRSTIPIVETASSFIKHNQDRIDMNFIAHQTGDKVEYLSKFSRDKIGKLVDDIVKQGFSYGNIAIIAQTNKELRELEHVFKSDYYYIPVEKSKYFLIHDFVFISISNLISLYLKKMEDDKALYWFLKQYKCDLNEQVKNNSIYQELIINGDIYDFYGEESSRYAFISHEDTKLLQLMQKLHQCFIWLKKIPVKDALNKIASYFFSSKINLTAFDQLLDIMEEQKLSSVRELHDYMTLLILYQDDVKVNYNLKSNNMIHMLTAHASKGLEFPVVILYGIDVFEKECSEEERRILYVALTRAEKKLYIIEIVHNKSTFLKELGEIQYNEGEDYL